MGHLSREARAGGGGYENRRQVIALPGVLRVAPQRGDCWNIDRHVVR